MGTLRVSGEVYGSALQFDIDLGRVQEAWSQFSRRVRASRLADEDGPRPGVARAKVRCACGAGPERHLNDGVHRTCTACGAEVGDGPSPW